MRLSCNDLDSFCWLSYTANINQEKVKEDDPSPKSLLLVLSCGGEVGLYDPLQGDRCMMRNNLKLTTVGWRICVPRRGSQCILWNARSESLFILDAVTLKLGEPLQLASAKDLIDLRIWQSNAAKKKATVNRDSSDPYGKSKIICLCADELVVFEWPEEQNKDLLALVRVQLTGNPPLR